jgi:competence protein ComEC
VSDLGGRPQVALHEWIKAQNDAVPYFAVRRDEMTSADGLTNDTIDPIRGCDRAPTDPQIRALWGGSVTPAEIGHNANNDSVVLRIDYGGVSMLLPGDLEIVGWAKLTKKYGEKNPVFDVDVYVLGHHGSKNATVPYMVQLMTPKVAVASAGPYDRYLRIANEFTARKFGHPNAKALEPLIDDEIGVSMWRPKPMRAWVGIKGGWALERMPVWEDWVIRRAVYATSWDGTVVVRGNANGFIDVQVERPEGKWKPDPELEASN